MFGKYKKKYLALLAEHETLTHSFKTVLEMYHLVVRQRDDLIRGETRKAVNNINTNGKTFTPAEIDRLIRLCHPDKHGNSVAATEMTKKLLAMR